MVMLVFSFTIFQGNGFSFHLVFRFFFLGECWWDFEILGKVVFVGFHFQSLSFVGQCFVGGGIESIDWYRVT